MALATKCSHCNTIFRVAADQLKLRGGIVRCGHCKGVFDGSANLVDPATLAPAPEERAPKAPVVELAKPAPVVEAPKPSVDVLALTSPSPDFDAAVSAVAPKPVEPERQPEPTYHVEFDTSRTPYPADPEPADSDLPTAGNTEVLPDSYPGSEFAREPAMVPPPEPDPTPEPSREPVETSYSEADTGHDLDERPAGEIDWKDLAHDAEQEVAAEVVAEPEPEPDPAPAPEAPPATDAEQEEQEEPGFVKRSRAQERAARTRRILMGGGSLLLLLALLGQGVTTYRNQVAAYVPALKPALVQVCKLLDCKIELSAQILALTIESGELQTIGANTFSFTTTVRNQSGITQAWPHLELVLHDGGERPLVRRVFTPAEYLPPPSRELEARGFAANTEQGVKLYFEVNKVKPSGYRIAVFYP